MTDQLAALALTNEIEGAVGGDTIDVSDPVRAEIMLAALRNARAAKPDLLVRHPSLATLLAALEDGNVLIEVRQ